MARRADQVTDDLTDTLLRHQVMLQRLTEGERAKFRPFLREMDTLLRDRLTRGELTEFSQARLEKLLKLVDGLLGEVLDEYQSVLFEDLNAIAANESQFMGRVFSEVLEVDFDLPSPTLVRAAVLSNPLSIKSGSLLKPFVKDWAIAERKAVTGAIRRGVFMGQTNAQIVQAVRGTRARQYQDGLLDVTARNARTVVHTAVQHVSSQAREATFDENEDIVEGVRIIATLDSKTCAQCRSLDQREFKRGKGPRSPFHPYCRCTQIPVLIKKFAALQHGGMRASIRGPVSAELDYYTWLKTQPRGFIEVALGPKRAKLFIDGGLSPERFAALQLDRRFEPLTLEEMRRLEPLAFERADI